MVRKINTNQVIFGVQRRHIPQHFLNLAPLPQEHGSFLPILAETIGFGFTMTPSVKNHASFSFLKRADS